MAVKCRRFGFDMMVESVSIVAAHGKEDNNDEATAHRSTVAFLMLVATHRRTENDQTPFLAFSCSNCVSHDPERPPLVGDHPEDKESSLGEAVPQLEAAGVGKDEEAVDYHVLKHVHEVVDLFTRTTPLQNNLKLPQSHAHAAVSDSERSTSRST